MPVLVVSTNDIYSSYSSHYLISLCRIFSSLSSIAAVAGASSGFVVSAAGEVLEGEDNKKRSRQGK